MLIDTTDINYGGLPFDEQRKLDRKAYDKYFNDCFSDVNEELDDSFSLFPMSFNSFYGTELHKKYMNPYLRKIKLDKIEKADD